MVLLVAAPAKCQPGDRPRQHIDQTDGTFEVEFTAKPDLSVPEKDEPTFHFMVYADVTDPAGETRSANRGVNVGYTAMSASIAADEWLTEGQPVKMTIATQTLDGEGQSAEGSVKIYRLKQPETVHHAGLSGPVFMPRPVQRGIGGAGNSVQDSRPRSGPVESQFLGTGRGRGRGGVPYGCGGQGNVDLQTRSRTLPRDAGHPGPFP